MSIPLGDGEPAGLGRLGVVFGGGLVKDDIDSERESVFVFSSSTLARFGLENKKK
jgi:hypothetical protein